MDIAFVDNTVMDDALTIEPSRLSFHYAASSDFVTYRAQIP